MLRLAILGALFLPVFAVSASAAQPVEKVGAAYVITREARTSTERDNQSIGSSFDRDMMTERVIGVRADGVELQYDLPDEATADDQQRIWQFPARIFLPIGGAPQLLNRTDLEARIDRWLKDAKLTRPRAGIGFLRGTRSRSNVTRNRCWTRSPGSTCIRSSCVTVRCIATAAPRIWRR